MTRHTATPEGIITMETDSLDAATAQVKATMADNLLADGCAFEVGVCRAPRWATPRIGIAGADVLIKHNANHTQAPVADPFSVCNHH